MDFNINPWCIAGAPVAAWARQVYPGVDDEIAVYRLWCAILSVARADGEDPESAWELHNATFEKNLRFLNDRHFDRLHYTSSNGTDLWVGLTDKHVWEGGSSETPDGHVFFPNIPTEEVFTSPHCERVDGVVHSALPLVRHGNKIDRFWLRFEGGSVVDFDAEVGRDTLASILDTDEGARRLGEVALISKNTPCLLYTSVCSSSSQGKLSQAGASCMDVPTMRNFMLVTSGAIRLKSAQSAWAPNTFRAKWGTPS